MRNKPLLETIDEDFEFEEDRLREPKHVSPHVINRAKCICIAFGCLCVALVCLFYFGLLGPLSPKSSNPSGIVSQYII